MCDLYTRYVRRIQFINIVKNGCTKKVGLL